MVNSAKKGKDGEREAAALIQTWWRKLEPTCEFIRTPQSGGWGSVQVRAKFRAAADLMTTAKHWPFATEVKKREEWVLENVVTGRPSPVWGWWNQTAKAAAELNVKPLLLFKKRTSQWYALVECPLAGPVIPTGNITSAHGSTRPLQLLFASDLFSSDPSLWVK